MLDKESSRIWTRCHHLGRIGLVDVWIQPRDFAYFASVFLHYLFLAACDSGNIRVLEYFFVFLFTSIFPDVFQSILVMASLSPNARLPKDWTIQRGKGMNVLSFGVKYGIVLHLFGFAGFVFGRCNFLLVSYALKLFTRYLPKSARNIVPKQVRNFLLNLTSDSFLNLVDSWNYFFIAILLMIPQIDSFWVTFFVSFKHGWKSLFLLIQMHLWMKLQQEFVICWVNIIAKGCVGNGEGRSFWNRINARLLSIHSLVFWCVMIAFNLQFNSSALRRKSSTSADVSVEHFL